MERRRLGATSLTLVGLIVLYGLGFYYFTYQVPFLVDSVVDRARLVVAFGFLMLIAGIEVTRWATLGTADVRRQTVNEWGNTAVRRDGEYDHWLVLAALGVALYMLLVILAVGKLGDLSQFFHSDTEMARANLRRSGSSGGYSYDLLMTSVGPFLSGVVMVRAIARRNSLMIVATALLCGILFVARLATLTKSMWVVYLVQLGFTYYAMRSLHLPMLKSLVFGALLLSALFLGSWLAFPEAPAAEIGGYLLYRIVQVTNEVMYQTLYVYPAYVPFANGLNIGAIASVAGYGVPAPAHSVVAAFFGAPGATFNAMFMSGAWVDFGWYGVGIVSFVVGACVKLYDIFTMSLGKSAVSCAMVGFAVIPVDQLLATSAQTAMLSGGLVTVPLLVFLSVLLVRTGTVEPSVRGAVIGIGGVHG
jgi:hypothetical protein